jgi:hypothetical protein
MISKLLHLPSEAQIFNQPTQRGPDEASERPPQGWGVSFGGPPPRGGPRAPKAHGGGGLGNYRLIRNGTTVNRLEGVR